MSDACPATPEHLESDAAEDDEGVLSADEEDHVDGEDQDADDKASAQGAVE